MLSIYWKKFLHAMGVVTKGEVVNIVTKATTAVILAAKIAGFDIEKIITQAKVRVEEAKSSLAEHKELVSYLQAQLLIAEQNAALAEAVLTNAEELVAALPEDGSVFDLVPVTLVKLHVDIPAARATARNHFDK